MKRESLPWRRMASFASLPLLSAIIPIAVLPLLVRSLGATGWSSIAIGMSIGAAGSILVNWGWGVIGPSEVARLDSIEAARVYRVSFMHRLLLALPTSAVVFALAEMLDSASTSGSAGVMAIATSLAGLSPAWYYIGIAKPLGIALWDTAPRLAAAALSIPLLLHAPDAMLYAALNVAICGATWIIAGAVIGRGVPPQGGRYYLRACWKAFLEQSWLTLSSLISGGYTSLTVAIVGAINFSAVAPFAAADRFRAMGKQGELAVTNGLQGWVGSARRDEQRRRMTKAMLVLSLLGLVAGCSFASIMPVLGPWLLGPNVHIDNWTYVFMGVALIMTGISMSTNLHVLAPLRKRRVMAMTSICGALVGVPAVAFGTSLAGSPGAAAGFALAELIVVAIQLPIALTAVRNLSGTGRREVQRDTHPDAALETRL